MAVASASAADCKDEIVLAAVFCKKPKNINLAPVPSTPVEFETKSRAVSTFNDSFTESQFPPGEDAALLNQKI